MSLLLSEISFKENQPFREDFDSEHFLLYKNKMEKEYSLEELINLTDEKIDLGEKLIKDLSSLEKIDGVSKLQRKINQELKFFKKAKTTKSIQINHILCSNLVHFKSLVASLLRSSNLQHVNYALSCAGTDRTTRLRIDIICDSGATWKKIVARNPKSLSDAVHGRSGYGAKSILDQAEEYIEAANLYPCLFKTPKVIFEFTSRIDEDLIKSLEDLGVEIQIKDEHFMEVEEKMDKNSIFDIAKNVKQLNLDITTLMAYVSSMTNGSCDWEFEEPILTEQARWERQNSIKPILEKLFDGKELICCEAAMNSFKDIVEMLGGPNEKKRSKEFLSQIKILPDVTEIPDELSHVSVGGKVKPRSLLIFAFGLTHKLLTVTSNAGFIRSTKMQGLNIPVFLHEARALTEQKENTAKKIV